MPRVSEFFGISIYLYYRDHEPPHFHAIYSGDEALISIETLAVLGGSLPPRAMGLVAEWGNLHREELRRVWIQAREAKPLDQIAPLR